MIAHAAIAHAVQRRTARVPLHDRPPCWKQGRVPASPRVFRPGKITGSAAIAAAQPYFQPSETRTMPFNVHLQFGWIARWASGDDDVVARFQRIVQDPRCARRPGLGPLGADPLHSAPSLSRASTCTHACGVAIGELDDRAFDRHGLVFVVEGRERVVRAHRRIRRDDQEPERQPLPHDESNP